MQNICDVLVDGKYQQVAWISDSSYLRNMNNSQQIATAYDCQALCESPKGFFMTQKADGGN